MLTEQRQAQSILRVPCAVGSRQRRFANQIIQTWNRYSVKTPMFASRPGRLAGRGEYEAASSPRSSAPATEIFWGGCYSVK